MNDQVGEHLQDIDIIIIAGFPLVMKWAKREENTRKKEMPLLHLIEIRTFFIIFL